MTKVKTNVDAYNYLIRQCGWGYRQDIQRGSFEDTETYRMQAYPLMIEITDPTNFLYLPKDVTVGMIEKYFLQYILGYQVAENEEYTYGSRMSPQLMDCFEMLSAGPQTNQAAMSISQMSDIKLSDPPCLRHIQFMFFNGKLNMISYWRSNDIGSAFLVNQGGLAMLLKEAGDYAGLDIGSHFYVSPGAHVYNYGGAS